MIASLLHASATCRLTVGALVLIGHAIAWPHTVDAQSDRRAADSVRVARALALELVPDGLPGACVATVSTDGAPVLIAGGYADIAAKRPYTTRTVQPVGSVSKTLIGYALAKAAVERRLDLDDPIAPHVPFVIGEGAAMAGVTWRQLATHTAGVIDREAGYASAYVSPASVDTSLGTFLRSYLHAGGTRFHRDHVAPDAVGRRYVYSNVGAALAGFALERLGGMAYSALLARDVFMPLGLADSRMDLLPTSPDDAVLYDDARRPVAPHRLITYPDGGWRTSCAQLATYLMSVLRAQRGVAGGLDSAAVRLMLTPQFATGRTPTALSDREPNLGLFWSMRRRGIGHSGSDPGVSAFVLVDPAAGTGQLFMTNIDISEGPAAEALTARFTRIWSVLSAVTQRAG
ncbi:MAG: beta-lactamase family protein [Gemmatimonadaceae bacterium]|jgi:CubicO group peptidase (beta-lactamase class C family)|nr:beta-lactamase family protein [Gemmatimonadaceae bacterium]